MGVRGEAGLYEAERVDACGGELAVGGDDHGGVGEVEAPFDHGEGDGDASEHGGDGGAGDGADGAAGEGYGDVW